LNSTKSLDQTLSAAATSTSHFVSTHTRSLSAAVVMGLAGFAVTAFGIAPMAPDVNKLPKRLVTENVTPDGIQSQLDALAEHDLKLYRTELTKLSDTADSLLKRLGVTDLHAAEFLRTDSKAQKLLEGRAGKMVRVQTDSNGQLTELIARYAPAAQELNATHFTRLSIKRLSVSQLVSTAEVVPLTAQVRIGSGTIRTSIFAATDQVRMPDNMVTQLADVFANELDLNAGLRKGATFSVLYEALTADGEAVTWAPATSGRVLAAEIVNNGRTHSAVWFKDSVGKGAYYSLEGQSKKRAFLPNPLEFSRVTSGFAMRVHPITRDWKQHKGVDFGAPMGTPIRAVGDGVVEFAGRQSGYGNVVELSHSGQRSTLYAHMNTVGVKQGERVEQGQYIGEVGATGWATGPHLHFEFKVSGIQQDPAVLVAAADSVPLTSAARVEFAQIARTLKGQLDSAQSMARSGAYAE
jgi:murein DD-endopeptidase MepM/ murein hydrolase activator NlpD